MSSYNLKEVGLPAKNLNNLSYAGPLLNIVPLLGPNRAPTTNNYNFPLACFWLNNDELAASPDAQGDLWYLAKKSNYLATWIKLSTGGTGPALFFTPSSGSVVFPTAGGNVNMTGGAGITVTGTTNTLTFALSGGGTAVDSFAVQAVTAPGVTPVLPTSLGLVTVSGAAVANHSVPLETRSRAANAFNIEVQYATSAAATDATKSGIAHFNSTQFSVDANGFVALAGGGAAIDQIAVDTFTGPGTNPVVPSVTGQITVTGAQVAAGTVGANAIRTDSLAANTYTIEIQRAAAASSSSVNNAGILSANSTQFSIDSSGWLQLVPGATPPLPTNLGIAYAGGTFTVCSQDGTALSATNPGIIWLQNKTTPGLFKRYLVTANQTFTDGAAGSFATMRWGLGAGVNWSNAMPFYLYAVTNDALDTIAFMISRIPHRMTSPAAASIGVAGTLVNVGQYDFYALPAITVANYDANPCALVGSFRMTFVGATNSWLVTTLDNTDGIGMFHEETLFVFPGGVFGASANTYLQANGGTAPLFTTNYYTYSVSKSGKCFIEMLSSADAGTDGVGAVQTNMTTPFLTVQSLDVGIAKVFNPTASIAYVVETSTGTPNTVAFIPVSNTATGNVLQNGDFTNGDRQITTCFTYSIAAS